MLAAPLHRLISALAVALLICRATSSSSRGVMALRRLCEAPSPNPLAIRRACAELEAAAAPPRFPQLWPALVGDWRLLYSSSASPRSLRGLEVTQRIALPELADLSAGEVQHVLRGGLLPVEVRLIHSARVTSQCCPAQLGIDLDLLRLGGLPPVASLIPQGLLRRGFFDTTFVDEEFRISRGLAGELRVFRRVR